MADSHALSILVIIGIVAAVGGVTLFLDNSSLTDDAMITGYAASRVPAMAHSGRTVIVPPHAVQVAPGLFDLGTAVVDNKVVRGYMFIDYKKNKRRYAKPGTVCGNGVCEQGENAKKCPADCAGGDGDPTPTGKCFAHLAKGARWKVTEPYLLNPANGDGLSSTFVASSIASSLAAWDAEVSFNIFGTGSLTAATLVEDTVAPDGLNEVFFAPLSYPNAIAVTIVWGIFSGPPRGRELVEWDMVFNDPTYKFGNAGPTSETSLGDTTIMDLLAIATHESGHAAGLGHPEDSCTEETMFRFATEGETKKRTLNAGDIKGIKALYK